MKYLMWRCDFVVVITIAGLLHLAESADVVSGYQRCYNTTEDTHCFDVLYDNTTNKWLTTFFDTARQRCNDTGSTLLIIKDEATNGVFQQFMNDTNNPIRLQSVWTDAYGFNYYYNFTVKYRWRWLDPTLPLISASGVIFQSKPDFEFPWYVAALTFNDTRFYLEAQQPQFNNFYVCENAVNKCPSVNSIDGKCYTASNESVNWLEARNRCLKNGGDLASFANVTSINFTSWLVSDPNVGYWIGLRYAGYNWIDTGEDVTFSKWVVSINDWRSPCLVVCFAPICNSNFDWFPTDCKTADTIKVVCHTATTLPPRTTSTSTVLTSSEYDVLQSYISLSPYQPRASWNHIAVGVGVGVGVGVLIIIAVLVMVICMFKRSGKLSEPKTHSNNNELGGDGQPSVGDVNDSGMDHYQHLDRNLDDSSVRAYDNLTVVAEPSYDELPPN